MDLDRANGGQSSAGELLQMAWLGVAARHLPTAAAKAHTTVDRCSVLVRRALHSAGRPLTLAELTQATGVGPKEIGSYLAKLTQRRLIERVPPPPGKVLGAGYLWVSKAEPGARSFSA